MWRILFLETIAGVPGMVAAMLRHFKSLRMNGRAGGWIHQLLEEAENERMHLLTFLALRQPNWFFRAAVLGAQGVNLWDGMLCLTTGWHYMPLSMQAGTIDDLVDVLLHGFCCV